MKWHTKLITIALAVFLSFFLYILPDPLSSIIGRCTLYTPGCRMKACKQPYRNYRCTRGDSPCTGDIQLTSRSEGRCTYLVSSLQMTLENACSDTVIFLAASGDRTWDLWHQRQGPSHWATTLSTFFTLTAVYFLFRLLKSSIRT